MSVIREVQQKLQRFLSAHLQDLEKVFPVEEYRLSLIVRRIDGGPGPDTIICSSEPTLEPLIGALVEAAVGDDVTCLGPYEDPLKIRKTLHVVVRKTRPMQDGVR